jgi:hypothetical protein
VCSGNEIYALHALFVTSIVVGAFNSAPASPLYEHGGCTLVAMLPRRFRLPRRSTIRRSAIRRLRAWPLSSHGQIEATRTDQVTPSVTAIRY